MKRDSKRLDDLEARLFSAYRSADHPAAPEGRLESVMREIGRRSAAGKAEGVGREAGLLAWRFAAAACVVALLLLAYVLSSGVIDYQELAMRFMENPIDFII